jgi:hypothetical protein
MKEVALMKRIILLATVALVMAAMLALAGPALAAPLHQHTVNTPGPTGTGDPEVAEGTCGNAPHDPAFENLHANFHLGAGSKGFEQPNNPVSITRVDC